MKDVYTFEDLQRWNEITVSEKPPVRLAVIGDPIAHSRSPQMQNAALEACKIDAAYTRLHIRAEELGDALSLLAKNDFIGANLTIPHKVAAMPHLDEMDDAARKIGAVNTVVVDDGKLLGFNTDGPGIVRAIRSEFGLDLRDLRVMILGAGGGAGRAISVQCGMESCERLVLVNRTFEKAKSLAEELAPYFKSERLIGPVARIEAIPWDDKKIRTQLQNTDLVINATPIGMKRTDASPLASALLLPHLMVYDTIYTAMKTLLLRAAEEAGARGANGRSLLLHQGALAFEIWFDREAPLDAMREALAEVS